MLMNGTNGNEPGYPEKALVPYPVILAATNSAYKRVNFGLQNCKLTNKADDFASKPPAL